IAWLPDASGVIGYIARTTISAVDNSSSASANLYTVGLDGNIGGSLASDQILPWDSYPAQLFVSPDGHSALTQFGSSTPYNNNVCRVDLSGGGSTAIIKNTNLFGAAPDLNYAITTATQAINPSKLLII